MSHINHAIAFLQVQLHEEQGNLLEARRQERMALRDIAACESRITGFKEALNRLGGAPFPEEPLGMRAALEADSGAEFGKKIDQAIRNIVNAEMTALEDVDIEALAQWNEEHGYGSFDDEIKSEVEKYGEGAVELQYGSDRLD